MSGSVSQHVDAVAELTRQGLTAPVIAERLGITRRTVQRARVRGGVSQPCPPNVGKRYTTEFMATIDRLLSEGWSYKEIARTYGASEGVIAKHFPGRGWTKDQASELAAVRRYEHQLFRTIENQRRNAAHLMPLADQLCRSGQPSNITASQSHTEAA